MKSKIFNFLGISAFTFASLIPPITINASSLKTNSTINEPIIYENQSLFEKKQEELKRTFGSNYKVVLQNNKENTLLAQKIDTSLKNSNTDTYPSYYGGMYISDDSENLIIQIVEKNIPEKNNIFSLMTISETIKYNSIVNMDDNIKVEYVENTYEELKNIQNQIYIKIASAEINKEVFDNFSSSNINLINNSIIVSLLDNSVENQKLFKKYVIDSPIIVFAKSEGLAERYATTLKAGSMITNVNNQPNCSVGFRAKVGSVEGYVTAAHCTKGLNTNLPTGKVIRYTNNSEVDAAFVQTNSSYTVSNDLAYPFNLIGINKLSVDNSLSCPFYAKGSGVALSGFITGYSSGKITDLNAVVKFTDGTTMNGVVATDVKGSNGDSGGPVFLPKPFKTDGVDLVGIVTGGSSNTMYFTKVDKIITKYWEYTRY